MLKESPAGPPIDRSQRHGSPVLLLLVTLVVVGAVLSLAVLDERHHATVLTLFLAGFAALGVLAVFLTPWAFSSSRAAPRAMISPRRLSMVPRMASSCSIARARFLLPTAPTRPSVVVCPPRREHPPVERLFSGAPDVSERSTASRRPPRGARCHRDHPPCAGAGRWWQLWVVSRARAVALARGGRHGCALARDRCDA